MFAEVPDEEEPKQVKTEVPEEKGRKQVKILAVHMSEDPDTAENNLQFFMLKLKEMGYFVVPDKFRKVLQKFDWRAQKHEVLELTVEPAESPAIDGRVVHVVPQEEGITHESFEVLFDEWVDKT